MPHYTYECESGHEFEIEQRITEDPLDICPKLGVDQDGEAVQCCSPCRRLIAGCSFVLRGGGWTGKSN